MRDDKNKEEEEERNRQPKFIHIIYSPFLDILKITLLMKVTFLTFDNITFNEPTFDHMK
jgi:hypothetical protein